MEEKTFTPGPWTSVYNQDANWYEVIASNDIMIATGFFMSDARLTASAPDLYAENLKLREQLDAVRKQSGPTMGSLSEITGALSTQNTKLREALRQLLDHINGSGEWHELTIPEAHSLRIRVTETINALLK
jgi:hypothetical protein